MRKKTKKQRKTNQKALKNLRQAKLLHQRILRMNHQIINQRVRRMNQNLQRLKRNQRNKRK